MNTQDENTMISLFDYLGKAAGGELGAECEKFHRIMNLPSSNKYIEQGSYKGNVKTYLRENLNKFFLISDVAKLHEIKPLNKKQQING